MDEKWGCAWEMRRVVGMGIPLKVGDAWMVRRLNVCGSRVCATG